MKNDKNDDAIGWFANIDNKYYISMNYTIL